VRGPEPDAGDGRAYIELAREIEHEVARVAADPEAGTQALVELFDRMGHEERDRVARAAFDRLPPAERWEIVERLFDDDELRALLAPDRERARAGARRRAEQAEAAARVRIGDDELDTDALVTGETLVLGLFREPDVRTAAARGRAATNSARHLVLRATDQPGALRVIEDVFNPDGGYFVTGQYDEAAWRAERLAGHSVVRVGSIRAGALVPVLNLGGRVDVEVDGEPREGRLHLGVALLGEAEVFIPT
jgi:hypothetical protein